jgi:hypothetical protein
MWRYNNITFIYDNRVGSVHGQLGYVKELTIYVKSKYALMQALEVHVKESYIGNYTEIDPRTVKHDKPIKV